jgi:hypothetical protein
LRNYHLSRANFDFAHGQLGTRTRSPKWGGDAEWEGILGDLGTAGMPEKKFSGLFCILVILKEFLFCGSSQNIDFPRLPPLLFV